jgi:hypothetical protein
MDNLLAFLPRIRRIASILSATESAGRGHPIHMLALRQDERLRASKRLSPAEGLWPLAVGQFAYLCAHCASPNVRRDAWAAWDVEAQAWEVAAVFDAGRCEDCDEARPPIAVSITLSSGTDAAASRTVKRVANVPGNVGPTDTDEKTAG